MPEQRKSRARKSEEKPQELPVTPEGGNEPPAVIVAMTEQADGSVVPQIAVQGGVKVTEVATILELAVVRWRAELGLT